MPTPGTTSPPPHTRTQIPSLGRKKGSKTLSAAPREAIQPPKTSGSDAFSSQRGSSSFPAEASTRRYDPIHMPSRLKEDEENEEVDNEEEHEDEDAGEEQKKF